MNGSSGVMRAIDGLVMVAALAVMVMATPLLDEADGQLGVAAGGGSIEQRHDAVHIARAWMLSAWAALMGA